MNAPPIIQPTRHRNWLWIAAGIGAVLVMAWVLWRFNPNQNAFYPRCLLHATTGIQCPGCGGLRATHQLLHGNLANAFALNALAICLLPFAAFFGLEFFLKQVRGRSLLPKNLTSQVPFGVLMGVVTGFTIARNLPLARWLGWH